MRVPTLSLTFRLLAPSAIPPTSVHLCGSTSLHAMFLPFSSVFHKNTIILGLRLNLVNIAPFLQETTIAGRVLQGRTYLHVLLVAHTCASSPPGPSPNLARLSASSLPSATNFSKRDSSCLILCLSVAFHMLLVKASTHPIPSFACETTHRTSHLCKPSMMP